MMRTPPPFIIITDPGPDPDDVKALLIAAILHAQGHIRLCAIVANGGISAHHRAQLARCILQHIGVTDVPVGVGTNDISAPPSQVHEYTLAGYADVRPDLLRDGTELLVDALMNTPNKSVRVVLISCMRDFARLCTTHPELVKGKVYEVAIQGGLVADPDVPTGWVPDTSQNNEFDREAASAVYAFCFDHCLPMSVTSRHAVPTIPMQLARSFADRTDCPIMRYLANAQFMGLVGLWTKLCAGKLPERCTKQWYFDTFCRTNPNSNRFSRQLDIETLGPSTDILPYLNGVVKPYDVIALMTVLPLTRDLFTRDAVFTYKDTEHRLFLLPEYAIPVEHVTNLLRDVYCEVVLASDSSTITHPIFRLRTKIFPLARSISSLLVDQTLHTNIGVINTLEASPSGLNIEDILCRSLELATHRTRRVLVITRVSSILTFACVIALICSERTEFTMNRIAESIPAILCVAIVTASFGSTGHTIARFEAIVTGCVGIAGLGLLIVDIHHSWEQMVSRPVAWDIRVAKTQLARRRSRTDSDMRVLDSVGTAFAYSYILVFAIGGLTNVIRAFAAGGYIIFGVRSHRALTPFAFKRAMTRWIGVVAIWIFAFDAWLIYSLSDPVLTEYQEVSVYGISMVVSGGIIACSVSRSFRYTICNAIGTCIYSKRSYGAIISLAPFIGYDSESGPSDIPTLITDAIRAFRVITLDTDGRNMLLAATHRHSPVRRPSLVEYMIEVKVKSDQSMRLKRYRRKLALARGSTSQSYRADAFVLRAPTEMMDKKLCEWAIAFETTNGRPPTVWLRELCADHTLSPTDFLRHLPCYIARCDRLLLLASPRTPRSIDAMCTYYAWRVIKGDLKTVDVLLDKNAPIKDTIAAFDTFHVMHATLGDQINSEQKLVIKCLRAVIRLAPVQTFNKMVRELLEVIVLENDTR